MNASVFTRPPRARDCLSSAGSSFEIKILLGRYGLTGRATARKTLDKGDSHLFTGTRVPEWPRPSARTRGICSIASSRACITNFAGKYVLRRANAFITTRDFSSRRSCFSAEWLVIARKCRAARCGYYARISVSLQMQLGLESLFVGNFVFYGLLCDGVMYFYR